MFLPSRWVSESHSFVSFSLWPHGLNPPTPDSSVHGIIQARIMERAAISFSAGIFLTRGSKPSLLHCRRILYHLSPQGSPCSLWSSRKSAYSVGLKLSPSVGGFYFWSKGATPVVLITQLEEGITSVQAKFISCFLFCSDLIHLVWPWTQSTSQHVWIWSSSKKSKNALAKTQLPVWARRKYMGQ